MENERKKKAQLIIYKLIKETKEELISKEMIKEIINITIEEMDRMRQEFQTWKREEMDRVISEAVHMEIQKLNIGRESRLLQRV